MSGVLQFLVKPDLICNSEIFSPFVTGRKMFPRGLPYRLCDSPPCCVGRVVHAVLAVRRRWSLAVSPREAGVGVGVSHCTA